MNNIFADNGNIATANITSSLRSLGDVTFDQDLSVTGTSNLGITNVGGALGVTGVATLDSSLIMSASGSPSATFNEINVRANQDINLSGTGRLVGPQHRLVIRPIQHHWSTICIVPDATGSAMTQKVAAQITLIANIFSEDRLYVNKLRVGGTATKWNLFASVILTFGPGTIVGTGVFTQQDLQQHPVTPIGGTVSFDS